MLTLKTRSTPKMHNPPHPGEIPRELCLQPLGLGVTEAAQALGVSRKTLSSILNGRSGISPEMVVELSIAFNTTSESWLQQQLQYDLAQPELKRRSLQVKKLAAAQLCIRPRQDQQRRAFCADCWSAQSGFIPQTHNCFLLCAIAAIQEFS